jgi:hypothetical protein
VDDLATDPRWPVLGPRAAERGIGSMLCLQLFVHRDTLGALDLLAHAPSAFTDESEHVGLLLASHAAIAAADAHHFEHVNSALVNRDVIGQAKGILMERFKITSDQAFAVLAKVSQDTNRKVSAVAEELARTGMWTPSSRAGQDRQDTPYGTMYVPPSRQQMHRRRRRHRGTRVQQSPPAHPPRQTAPGVLSVSSPNLRAVTDIPEVLRLASSPMWKPCGCSTATGSS